MSGSDVEMETAPKKSKKITKKKSDKDKEKDPKKLTTKEMIIQALVDLKTRKGTSLYAIKKYLEDNYKLDVEKNNYLIKRYLKLSVETGIVIQTKGIGASGSFKLASKDTLKKMKNIPEKSKKPKLDKPVKTKAEVTENTEKKPKKTEKKPKKPEKKPKKVENLDEQGKMKKKSAKKAEKLVKMSKSTKQPSKTPVKKREAIMKRKSIGSIIKPPKMRPSKI